MKHSTTDEEKLFNNKIKNNIEKIRYSRKMTQEKVAEIMGISHSSYRVIITTSTSRFQLLHIVKFAEAMKIKIDEIVNYERK